ncbi:hypothetical protein HDU93_005817, partial [Gonapodya sp. JEL0774]
MDSLDSLGDTLLTLLRHANRELIPSLAALASALTQRSTCLKFALLEDPALSSLVKAALKRFPDGDGMTKEKHLQSFIQARLLHTEQLQPVVDIMMQVSDWSRFAIDALKTSVNLVGVD